jgi:biofilm protein TabA
MAILGSLETVRAQSPRTAAFATAFAYAQEVRREGSAAHARLFALEPGKSARVELGEGVFAMEQAYLTKPRADGFFESHRRLIDVQVVVAGREIIEVIDAARSPVQVPYDSERDFTHHADAAGASIARLEAGDVAVFFPSDVHMPGLRAGAEAVLVRKTVVKVPVG